MISYNQNGITITYYDNNRYLSGFTEDKTLFEDIKVIFGIDYGTPKYLYFIRMFDTDDEALDFFCGNKWPPVFNQFIEEVVTKLTEGKLC